MELTIKQKIWIVLFCAFISSSCGLIAGNYEATAGLKQFISDQKCLTYDEMIFNGCVNNNPLNRDIETEIFKKMENK